MIHHLLNWTARLKTYFTNTLFYMSVANFVMILASFKLLYKVPVSVWIVVPAGFLLVLAVGYIDYRFIFGRQLAYTNQKNDLKMQLDRIEKRLEERGVWRG